MNIKKIKELTKIFAKESYQVLNIYNSKNKKLNVKSIFLWMVAIIIISIFYLSYQIINFLVSSGVPEVFLNFYLLILFIILSFQTILRIVNILFFSKSIKNILPLPISNMEILISKFGGLLFLSYVTELVFGLIPLFMYGMLAAKSLMYFLLMILVLAVFPIIIVSVFCIITLLLMKVFNFIKNPNIIEAVVTIILLILIIFMEQKSLNNLSIQSEEGQQNITTETYLKTTSYFLVINPSIEILAENGNIIDIITNFLKIIGYNIVAFGIFLIIGKKLYFKLLLKCNNYEKNKKDKIIILKDKYKNKSVLRTYLKRDLMNLFKNGTFFIQTVFPVIIILITMILIGTVMIPIIDTTIQNDENIKNSLASITINTEVIGIILCVAQILFSISSLSLTAISREGRDAILIKYLPVDLYKQFKYKNIPQVVLNILVSIVILGLVYYFIPSIGILNILLLFILLLFINLINSYLMLITDLRRPMLNWDSEQSVIKKNDNKVFQYFLMIIMVLIILYLANIFKNINLTLGIIIEIILFSIIFIIIDRLVKKNCKKLFNKIV